MKFSHYFSVLLLCMYSLVSFAQDKYLLNAGDVLNISVWNEDALQKDVIVLPDGMISFPLIGSLLAQGKTITELKAHIADGLSEYISSPVVTVSVTEVRGNNVHVIGKVVTPGSIVMSQTLDVMQALSLSGGFSPYAKEDEIIVMRRENGQQQTFKVDYSAIKQGKSLDTNILLESGDVIIIP